jgi:hypothetical protein
MAAISVFSYNGQHYDMIRAKTRYDLDGFSLDDLKSPRVDMTSPTYKKTTLINILKDFEKGGAKWDPQYVRDHLLDDLIDSTSDVNTFYENKFIANRPLRCELLRKTIMRLTIVKINNKIKKGIPLIVGDYRNFIIASSFTVSADGKSYYTQFPNSFYEIILKLKLLFLTDEPSISKIYSPSKPANNASLSKTEMDNIIETIFSKTSLTINEQALNSAESSFDFEACVSFVRKYKKKSTTIIVNLPLN